MGDQLYYHSREFPPEWGEARIAGLTNCEPRQNLAYNLLDAEWLLSVQNRDLFPFWTPLLCLKMADLH
jgi:hypothetical protein